MHFIRSNAIFEATDRFCSTVVFILNELFVTVHVDDILNTDNNKYYSVAVT